MGDRIIVFSQLKLMAVGKRCSFDILEVYYS